MKPGFFPLPSFAFLPFCLLPLPSQEALKLLIFSRVIWWPSSGNSLSTSAMSLKRGVPCSSLTGPGASPLPVTAPAGPQLSLHCYWSGDSSARRYMRTQHHPEREGTAFSLFFESCFFEREETFSKKLLSRPPLTEHWPTCHMPGPEQVTCKGAGTIKIGLDSLGSVPCAWRWVPPCRSPGPWERRP